MSPVFVALFALLASTFRTRAAQQVEIVALRHQIAVLQRNAPRRLRLKQSDRLLWILLSRFWSGSGSVMNSRCTSPEPRSRISPTARPTSGRSTVVRTAASRWNTSRSMRPAGRQMPNGGVKLSAQATNATRAREKTWTVRFPESSCTRGVQRKCRRFRHFYFPPHTPTLASRGVPCCSLLGPLIVTGSPPPQGIPTRCRPDRERHFCNDVPP